MRFLYNDKGTAVHRMSPQAKLLGVLISFVFPVAFNHPAYTAAVTLAALGLATAARAWDVLFMFKRLLVLLFFISWLLWSVLLGVGEPIADWGPFSVSSTSLLFGAAMGFRITCYLVIGLTFLAVTSIEELTAALRSMGLPFSIGFALSTSFRLVPTFVETTKAVAEAQRARGLGLDRGSPIAKARKHVPLIIPILASCLRRANTMAMALEARGFGSRGVKTSFCQGRLTFVEGLILAALGIAAAAVIYLRIDGYGVLVAGRL